MKQGVEIKVLEKAFLFYHYAPSDSRKKERVGSVGTPDESGLLHQDVGLSGDFHSQPEFTFWTLELQLIWLIVINVSVGGLSLSPPRRFEGLFRWVGSAADRKFCFVD